MISPPALAQLGCLLVLGVAIARAPAFPARALAVSVPVGAAAFLERERLDGPMFNYEAFGGYLGYRLRTPVYWDGRNDVFLPLAIEFAHAPSFAALVRSHGLTLAVLNPGYHQRFGPELARPPLSFGLVYFDAISAIHVARTPQHAALLARAEYRHLRPFAVPSDADLARAAAEPRLLAEVEREARRLLAQGGDAFVAHYVLGGLLHARGKLAEAARELELAQRLAPDDARLLYKRALIARASGREREAGALLERAMAIAAP